MTKFRVAPKAGIGERQLTCDEIDDLKLIPHVQRSSIGRNVNQAISKSIDRINQDIQAKKDYCAGKLKPKSEK